MRLDHLLSREEVGVGLLLICQGGKSYVKVSAQTDDRKDKPAYQDCQMEGCIRSATGREASEDAESGRECVHERIKERHQQFLVAMRLRGTPVPIPNTMVKT